MVDDKKIMDAISVLDNAGLAACKDGTACEQAFHQNIPEVRPSVHLHMDRILNLNEGNIQFMFYRRSKTLLELPVLATLDPKNPHPDLLLTDVDQRLDREGHEVMEQQWKHGKDLWIPTVRALIRSFILLAAHTESFDARSYWDDRVITMLIYLPKQGHFNGDAGHDVQPLIDYILGKDSSDYNTAMEETISRVKRGCIEAPGTSRRKTPTTNNPTPITLIHTRL